MPTPMRVLIFASQKGGSGKTTLAGHIAVQAELAGAGPVMMIDTDPQGSLEKWWEARNAPAPGYIKAEGADLSRALAFARDQGARLVVVDTPPAVTRAISDVVSFADFVIVPTRPSPHDLRAVGPTVDIVEWHRKQLVFVINAASPRAKITADAAVALSQHGTVAPATIHHRVDFAASMIDGRTVMEIREDGKSAQEVKALWDYLADRIARMNMVETDIDGDELRPAKTASPPPRVSAPRAMPASAGKEPAVAFGNVNALGQRAPAFGRRAG